MKAFHLPYNKSLTMEKTIMIDFNQHSELVAPRFDFGYNIQVHNYRH
jgi:hypothetical protein